MIISNAEKKQVLLDILDPREAKGTFHHLIQRWCSEYPSTRAGILDLKKRIEDSYGAEVSFDTLRKYADGVQESRDPKLSTVAAVLGIILKG